MGELKTKKDGSESDPSKEPANAQGECGEDQLAGVRITMEPLKSSLRMDSRAEVWIIDSVTLKDRKGCRSGGGRLIAAARLEHCS
jgi:hypothetical protein